MSIEALYESVTEAILRAEALEERGMPSEVSAAYLRVSFLEEEIANLVPPSDPEGAIARRGAVRASLKARLPVHARDLAERFAAEAEAPAALLAELREMAATAEASMELSALKAVPVVPNARDRFPGDAA